MTYYLSLRTRPCRFQGFFYLPPAEAFCVDSIEVEKCSRPDLFAFQIVSGAAIAYCAASGFRSWHLSGRVHRKTPATPEGRLFGYLEEAENLAVINFTFQIWDFLVSLTIPEHRTTVFLCHHLAAAVVCWFSLSYQVSAINCICHCLSLKGCSGGFCFLESTHLCIFVWCKTNENVYDRFYIIMAVSFIDELFPVWVCTNFNALPFMFLLLYLSFFHQSTF